MINCKREKGFKKRRRRREKAELDFAKAFLLLFEDAALLQRRAEKMSEAFHGFCLLHSCLECTSALRQGTELHIAVHSEGQALAWLRLARH